MIFFVIKTSQQSKGIFQNKCKCGILVVTWTSLIMSFTYGCYQIDIACISCFGNCPFSYAGQIMNCIILHNFGFETWIFSLAVSAIVESLWILLPVLTLALQMPLIKNRSTIQSHWNLLSNLCLAHNCNGLEWAVFSLSAENCAHLQYGCLNKWSLRRK